MVPILIANTFGINCKNKIYNLQIKNLIYKYFVVILSFLILFILVNPFIYVEGLTTLEKYIEWKKNIYLSSPEYLVSNNSYIYYLIVTTITSFGIPAYFLFILGLICLIRTDFSLMVSLIACPLILIGYFGQYDYVLIRNMVLALPFILVFISYGFFTLIYRINNKYLRALLVLILFLEPVTKSMYSYLNDF